MIIKNGQVLKATFALLIGSLFALIIAEMFLQIIDFPTRPISGWLNCKSKNPGECNSMGFRGREIAYSDEDFVVVLLGDSEVYAVNSLFDQIPERRLEDYLQNYKENVKVFSIADMGYGQDQQYFALRKYFKKHRADLIILMFTARNDIENNMFPVSGKNYTIKPTLWLQNNELHGPIEGWLEPAGSWFKLKLLWQFYIGRTIGELRMEKWDKEILPPPYKPLIQYEGDVDNSWQQAWNKDRQLAFKGIELERFMMGNYFTPRSQMREYGINLTRKLFFEIKKLTEANNGHFFIVKENRPQEFQVFEKKKAYVMNSKYYKVSTEQYEANLEDLFHGFENYKIHLNMHSYTSSSDDQHLNQQAIDKLIKELSVIISRKEYFKEK